MQHPHSALYAHWRRTLAGVLSLAALFCATNSAQAQSKPTATTEITDLAGRKVSLPARVDRILLGEGRLLPALAILEREAPLQRLVGMMGDFEQLDPAGYRQWRTRFPALDAVPRIGKTQGASYSDEKALALRPQVAIFGLGGGHGPGERNREILARLEQAGTAVVFVDFRHEPLINTPRSIELLGRILGRPTEAAEFNAHWRQELDRVQRRLPAAKQMPRVYLESRAGLNDACCDTMVGMMGKLLDAAGGDNIARGLIPGEHGTLNLEYLLARQPEVYIATAIGAADTPPSSKRIAAGAGVSRAQAQQSLRSSLARAGISALSPVRNGRAYAIWHHFYNSPFNVVAVQVMAQWLYPERFPDLDPRRTLDTMYQRFQPFPLDGEYWTGPLPK